MFQEIFCMFKAFKKNMWINGFFVSKLFLPYQMFTKSFQFFCGLQYIPQEGIHVFKTFKNLKYIYLFRF